MLARWLNFTGLASPTTHYFIATSISEFHSHFLLIIVRRDFGLSIWLQYIIIISISPFRCSFHTFQRLFRARLFIIRFRHWRISVYHLRLAIYIANWRSLIQRFANLIIHVTIYFRPEFLAARRLYFIASMLFRAQWQGFIPYMGSSLSLSIDIPLRKPFHSHYWYYTFGWSANELPYHDTSLSSR
jgi:hypothetical protein